VAAFSPAKGRIDVRGRKARCLADPVEVEERPIGWLFRIRFRQYDEIGRILAKKVDEHIRRTIGTDDAVTPPAPVEVPRHAVDAGHIGARENTSLPCFPLEVPHFS
jgi:hypothetical protein